MGTPAPQGFKPPDVYACGALATILPPVGAAVQLSPRAMQRCFADCVWPQQDAANFEDYHKFTTTAAIFPLSSIKIFKPSAPLKKVVDALAKVR